MATFGTGDRVAVDKPAETQLDFTKLDGLVPAVIQDHATGQVLMVGFMNQEAWERTLATGLAHFYSRSRRQLWKKGGTSGHLQRVKEIWLDCDEDTVLLKVEQVGGAACHTGHVSCFHRRLADGRLEVCGEPVFDPREVYR